jgi:hypothetical protein
MTVDPASTSYVFPAETDVFAHAANVAPDALASLDDTPDGAETGLWGEDGFTFGDLVDLVNPLQHVPILSSLYRAVTGDDIAPASRMLGGGLYGGPLGLGDHLIALLDSDSSATTALARAINNGDATSPTTVAAAWPDADPAQPPTATGGSTALAVAAKTPPPAPAPAAAAPAPAAAPAAAYSEDDLAKAARLAKLTGEDPRVIAERLAHLRRAQSAPGAAKQSGQAVAALAGGAPTAASFVNDDLAKAARLAKLTGEDPRVIAERLARLRRSQALNGAPAGAAAGTESVTTSALPPRVKAPSFVSYLPNLRRPAAPVAAPPAALPAAPVAAARPDPRLHESHQAYRNGQNLRGLFAAPQAGGA